MKNLMFYSKHMSFKNQSFTNVFRDSSHLFLPFILFICGLFFGSALYYSGDHALSVGIIQSFLSFDFVHFSIFSVSDTVISILIGIIGGFCAIGTFIMCAVPFIKGFGIASLGSYLIGTYAAKGLGYFSLIFLPGIIVSVCITLYFTSESQRMSKTIANMAFLGEREAPNIKAYFTKALTSALGMLFSAFLTLVSFKLFSGLF